MRFDILWSESQNVTLRQRFIRPWTIDSGKSKKLVLEIAISFIGIISNKKGNDL
jgi:hypothetical protein